MMVTKIPAKVNANSVWAASPVAVTVSRDGKQARFFRRGKLVKTYTVAVGAEGFATPPSGSEALLKGAPWMATLKSMIP